MQACVGMTAAPTADAAAELEAAAEHAPRELVDDGVAVQRHEYAPVLLRQRVEDPRAELCVGVGVEGRGAVLPLQHAGAEVGQPGHGPQSQ